MFKIRRCIEINSYETNNLSDEFIKTKDKFSKGKLKIFFGYAKGIGKTYTMLKEAKEMKNLGKDVVIGYLHPYKRDEFIELIKMFEEIEPKMVLSQEISFKEFDLDKALLRKPELLIVDELAYTNKTYGRHKKRWQDIEELLCAGINVYTTLNVENIDSLKETIEKIAGIFIEETVPDRVFDSADKIELIDIEPDELIARILKKNRQRKEDNKICENLYTKGNLFALREICFRRVADRMNYEVENVKLSRDNITVVPNSEKILACITTSPSSLKIIRTASKMAESYHCKWVALYVQMEKFQEISSIDKENLNNTFNLAQQLGGETVTLYGEDVLGQIIDYAKFRNITKLIIGKSRRRIYNVFNSYSEKITDQFIKLNYNIDVYVVPNVSNNKEKRTLHLNSILKQKIPLRKTIYSSLIIIIATIIGKAFSYVGLTESNIIMIYILAVILICILTNGYIIGFISSIASVLLFNYFFTTPTHSFEFYDKSYLATFIIMLMVSFIIGTLTNKIKYEAKNSSLREKQTENLYRVSKQLLSATGISEIVTIGIKYTSRLIQRTVVCYLGDNKKLSASFVYNYDNSEKKSNVLNSNEEIAAYWTFLNGKESGAGTDTFYKSNLYYMPIKGKKKILGVIGVSCYNGILETEQRYILDTVCSQMAVALDREIYSKEQESSKIEIERERLRSNLLRSISHDLRSPLAGIKGSVSTIIENENSISEGTRRTLLNGIFEDAEWLIRLVENLLNMTRFDEGKTEIKKNIELVEEVVSEAVQKSSKRCKEHKIKVSIPMEVIMVSMDGILIEQVLINLIDNAVKFTPKGSLIEIKSYETEDDVFFEVIDDGPGIEKEILPHIFDRFFTNGSKVSDSRRGVGLGLAICKSIVEGHNGKITAHNKESGGTIFKFNIPKEK